MPKLRENEKQQRCFSPVLPKSATEQRIILYDRAPFLPTNQTTVQEKLHIKCNQTNISVMFNKLNVYAFYHYAISKKITVDLLSKL